MRASIPSGPDVALRERRRIHRGGVSVLRLLLALPLLSAAFVDIPARVQLGPISGLGVWTSVLAIFATGGLLSCGPYPKRLLLQVLPYFSLLAWAALSMIWAPPDFWGVQNGTLYALFGSLVVIAGAVSARHPFAAQLLIGRCILWIDCISLGIVLASVALWGLPVAPGTWLFGPRGFALLGLIPLSWHLAGWYSGARGSFILSCLWMIAIGLSLSRTAAAISLLLLGVTTCLSLRLRLRKALWSSGFLLMTLTAAGALVVFNDTFRDRVFGGDRALDVGFTAINTEGRLDIWKIVVSSALESPIVGKGLGSSQVVLNSRYPRLRGAVHPHNDYLRLWHDFGIVGLFLFLLSAGNWLLVLFHRWYHAERQTNRCGHVELAGLLALLGVLLAMVTDNVIVYVFTMGPLAVLVGAGMGFRDSARY